MASAAGIAPSMAPASRQTCASISSCAILDPALFGAPYDFTLADRLAEAGLRVEMITRPQRATDPILPESFDYVPLFSRYAEQLRSGLPRKLFSAVKGAEYVADNERLVAHLKRSRPSIVHYLWLPFAVWDVRIIRRLGNDFPIVYTMHNKVPFHGGALSAQRVFRSEWLRLFDAIIVHTQAACEHIEATGYPGDRIAVLHHPPLSLAEPTPEDRAAIPKKRKCRVLMWGALKPYKGVDRLLDASKRLWANGVEHELALAGQPFFDVSSHLQAVNGRQSHGDLILDFGTLDESRITAHIEAADIVVFPYKEIDASGALMATLACKKPVLATAVGGFEELRRQYGVDLTFSVPPDDAPALAERLGEIITNSRARLELAAEAQNLLARHPSWADMRDGVLQVYERARKTAARRLAGASDA